MKSGEDQIWDVVVIGGGPAGMMAAGRAAERRGARDASERGPKVLLLEKNDTLGKKLLITGGGRCNVTNAEFDDHALLAKFKENGKYLFSAFSQWSVKESLDFFHLRDMETKIENEKRVFPVTNKAQSVWDVLVGYLKQNSVEVRSNAEVTSLCTESVEGNLPAKGTILSVRLKGGEEIRAKSFVLATGGKSRPETGSTGDGFVWLKNIGHTVTEPQAVLVPVALKDEWIKGLQGATFQDIRLTLFQNGQKQESSAGKKNGKLLFTHFGISGPTVLNMSQDIGELLKYGEVVVALDLFPDYGHDKINTMLMDLFAKENRKKLKNALSTVINANMATVVMELAGIDLDTTNSNVTREQRLKLIQTLKHVPMNVKELLGTDKAIVTSGGVKLDEVDFKTMQSRLFPNLYLVGDVLNIDRPSGGYSLQLCWTTGFVAGNNV
jgi:predicted Rossmann fold flavoprotein